MPAKRERERVVRFPSSGPQVLDPVPEQIHPPLGKNLFIWAKMMISVSPSDGIEPAILINMSIERR